VKKLFLFLLLSPASLAQDTTFYLSDGTSIIAQPTGANSYYVYRLNPSPEYPKSEEKVVVEQPKKDPIAQIDDFISALRASRER
jgi:hypothetical protein